jgi:predicted nucleic acid-binding Zn ribbon protein
MNGMDTEARTRYSVVLSRNERRRERTLRYVLWGLVLSALVVIVVFAVLLLTGGGA